MYTNRSIYLQRLPVLLTLVGILACIDSVSAQDGEEGRAVRKQSEGCQAYAYSHCQGEQSGWYVYQRNHFLIPLI
jgi:hypothetical protein